MVLITVFTITPMIPLTSHGYVHHGYKNSLWSRSNSPGPPVRHLDPLRTLRLQHEQSQSLFELSSWGLSLHIQTLRQSSFRFLDRTIRQDIDRKSYG